MPPGSRLSPLFLGYVAPLEQLRGRKPHSRPHSDGKKHHGALAQLVGRGKRTFAPASPRPPAKFGRKISASLICSPADSLSRPAFRKCRPVRVSPLLLVPGTTTTFLFLRRNSSSQSKNSEENHHGALAQLVARYIRIVEVSGSNPLCSTTQNPLRNQGISDFS
jgi:hypothetical protein